MEQGTLLSNLFIETIWPRYESRLRLISTRRLYLSFIKEICRHIGRSFENITYVEAFNYFNKLQGGQITFGNGKEYEVSSIYERWCVCRSLSRFMFENVRELGLENYIPPFDALNVSAPVMMITGGDIPRNKEILKLMDSCKGGYSYIRYVIGLAFYCGLSVSEIVRLDRRDVFDAGEFGIAVAVRGKHADGDGRFITVPEPFASELIKYVNDLEEDQGPLFITRRGTPLMPRDMQRGLKALGTEWTLCSLRNAAGCRLMSECNSSEKVAEFLGVTERHMYRFEPAANRLTMEASV